MFSRKLHPTYLEWAWFFTQQGAQHSYVGEGFTLRDFPKIVAHRTMKLPAQIHPRASCIAFSNLLICTDYYTVKPYRPCMSQRNLVVSTLPMDTKQFEKVFDLGQSLTTWSISYDFVCSAIIILELCSSCIARKQLKCYHQNQNEGAFLLLLGRWSIYVFPNSSCQVQLKPLHYI